MPNALDIKGKRFGRLVVLHKSEVKAKNVMWVCMCDCGNTTVGAAANLGKTKFSCGCFKSEGATASLRINRLAKPGLHGKSNTTEWNIWSKMRDRCNRPKNSKYHRYGGRGIKVCDRWNNNFEAFLEDMGLRPSKRYSLDRINNDLGYSKENCRWATAATQIRNSTTVHMITIDDKTYCIKDWCKILSIPEWKPQEMVRSRDGRPAKFPDIESALTHLYNLSLQPKRKPKFRRRYHFKAKEPISSSDPPSSED